LKERPLNYIKYIQDGETRMAENAIIAALMMLDHDSKLRCNTVNLGMITNENAMQLILS
jgi:hypothetical protein